MRNLVAAPKEDELFSGRIAPNGKVLVLRTSPKRHVFERLQFFEVATGKPLGKLENLKHILTFDLTNGFAQGGDRFAYQNDDGGFTLVDVQTGKSRRVQVPPRGADSEFAPSTPRFHRFSPDGRFFVTLPNGAYAWSGKDSTIVVTEVATDKDIRRFAVPPLPDSDRASLWYFAVSPDNRLLAGSYFGDKDIYLWEIASGRVRGKLAGHKIFVWSVEFSPDGRLLASSSTDTTVLIWDVRRALSGKPRAVGQRTPAELATLWKDLGEPDAMRADDAIWTLIHTPQQSVPLLRQRVQPIKAPPVGQVERLIADLDSKVFKVRQHAETELVALQELAVPALVKALAHGPVTGTATAAPEHLRPAAPTDGTARVPA